MFLCCFSKEKSSHLFVFFMNKQQSYCFEIPVSHNSPMYPGLQPASHLPVVTLHALSFKQLVRLIGEKIAHLMKKAPNLACWYV